MYPGRADPLRRIPGINSLAPYASIIYAVSPDHREENTQPNRRVLIQLKNSLSPIAPAMAFNIENSAVAWSNDAEAHEFRIGFPYLFHVRRLPVMMLGIAAIISLCLHTSYGQYWPGAPGTDWRIRSMPRRLPPTTAKSLPPYVMSSGKQPAMPSPTSTRSKANRHSSPISAPTLKNARTPYPLSNTSRGKCLKTKSPPIRK